MAPAQDTAEDAALPRPLLVGLLGAECTGKSTLAKDLADSLAPEFSVEIAAEALRDFVRQGGRAPSRGEQAGVMAAQLDNERAASQRVSGSPPRVITICDPCALMTAIYSLAYFDDGSLFASALDHQLRYDVVFWCQSDFPWEPDPGQRDGPVRRAQVEALIADTVTRHQLSTVRVHGPRAARLSQALAAIHGAKR